MYALSFLWTVWDELSACIPLDLLSLCKLYRWRGLSDMLAATPSSAVRVCVQHTDASVRPFNETVKRFCQLYSVCGTALGKLALRTGTRMFQLLVMAVLDFQVDGSIVTAQRFGGRT